MSLADKRDDRAFTHPLETARDLTELVHVLDRLAVALEHEEERESKWAALHGVGQFVNNVLYSGAAILAPQSNGSYLWTKRDFRSAFAAVTIEDPNAQGPLLVTGGSADDALFQSGGPNRWVVPRGGRRTIAMTSSELSICAFSPPAWTQVLTSPVAAYADLATTAGPTALAAVPPAGQIRVRDAWLSVSGGTTAKIQGGTSGQPVLWLMAGATGTIGPSGYGENGPILAVGDSLVIVQNSTVNVAAGAIYDIVATTGPRLVYVTVHADAMEASS